MATTNTFPLKQNEDSLKNMPEAAASLGDRAKNLTDAAIGKVKDAAGTVADTAKDAVSSVGHQAERATHAVGSGMESMAGTIREKMANKGALRTAASSVADGLETSGKYLETEGIKGIADDVTNLIRRNPFPAILVGVALGYLIGRVTAEVETMSVDLKTPEDASVTTLVSGILHDAQELVKQQTELFKHEVRIALRKSKEASLTLGAGAGLALAGVIMVALMLAELLQWAVPSLPMWACYGAGGLPLLIAGASLIYAGKLKFESLTAMPQESMQALKEDLQWITNRK